MSKPSLNEPSSKAVHFGECRRTWRGEDLLLEDARRLLPSLGTDGGFPTAMGMSSVPAAAFLGLSHHVCGMLWIHLRIDEVDN